MVLKGPKAILSSAIANALGAYFLVDASAVEANLLSDARIVLRDVALKERAERVVPRNGAGDATRIVVSGSVEEVSFAWAWNSERGAANWATDAVLTVAGAKFRARLERVGSDEAAAAVGAAEEGGKERGESFVDPATIDEASARNIRREKGGLAGFVDRQVKMVMDMLTLKMVDFELRIELPHCPMSPGPAAEARENLSALAAAACHKTISVAVERIEILSLGRLSGGESSRTIGIGDEGKESAPTKLKQRINLSSFACSIHLEGSDLDQTVVFHPLIEPFSYSADVFRFGERFGGFMKGLEVLGLDQPACTSPDSTSLAGAGFKVHLGAVQIDSLMQLSVMILAPPEDEASDSELENPSENSAPSPEGEGIFVADDPSLFHFPLASASLVMYEETHFKLSGIQFRYRADGTTCEARAEKMEFDSTFGWAGASQVVMTMRPVMKMSITSIEEFVIPDTLFISHPIQSSEITYEGQTISIRLGSLVEVATYSKEETPSTEASGPTITAPQLPLNINLHLEKGMNIKKTEDGSIIKCGTLNIYGLSEDTETKIAMQCESLRNHIVSMTIVSTAGTLPFDEPDVVRDFFFTAGEILMTSGYTTDEWEDAFQTRKSAKVEKSKPKSETASSPIKLPFASIADLRVTIGARGSHNVAGIKETTMTIKSFQGKETTTTKDLASYYIARILTRVPGFITNAEVLGLNVFDNATGMLSNWAGIATLGTTLGAGAGVAAVTAVDAIKGAVDAGKRSRKVDETAATRPLDLFRGVIAAANEATQDGAKRRGKIKEDGNLIDWTVGATAGTAKYVKGNKNRLGAAGAGGGGFLVGSKYSTALSFVVPIF